MATAKRLTNVDGVRGTPAVGEGPISRKRGLRGAFMALWAETTAQLNPHDRTAMTYTTQTGQDGPSTGNPGVGVDGADLSLVGRGEQYQPTGDPKVSAIPDNRALGDVDPAPLGASETAALATFTAATGSGAAGTIAVTPANATGYCQVAVFARGADTDEDADLLAVAYVAADGSGHTVTVGSAHAGETVSVYARRVSGTDTAPGSVGRWFATRRTAAVHS